MNDFSLEDLTNRLEQNEILLRKLSDRQEILDCSHRFCRGINRLDRALLRSAFHPDAVDNHGLYLGGPDGFVAWIETLYDNLAYTQHYVMNQSVELQGNTAHSEQYWFVVNVQHGSPAVVLRGGRYIDRYEQRMGRWAIAVRACLVEWNAAPGEFVFPEAAAEMLKAVGNSARDMTDLSYQRPLEIRQPSNGEG